VNEKTAIGNPKKGRQEIMQYVLAILAAFHILPAVFWAGTTFALARSGGAGAEGLARQQLGAATVAILAGLALMYLLHNGVFGRFEQVLGVGALCAIAAAGVQSGMGMPALRRLARASAADALLLRERFLRAQRIAAALLAITVVCMAVARFV
jgi:hypothetical protein